MTIYHVKPYREVWLHHLVRLQFRTAFCALFGLARWNISARRCSLLGHFGISAAGVRARIAELKGGAIRDD